MCSALPCLQPTTCHLCGVYYTVFTHGYHTIVNWSRNAPHQPCTSQLCVYVNVTTEEISQVSAKQGFLDGELRYGINCVGTYYNQTRNGLHFLFDHCYRFYISDFPLLHQNICLFLSQGEGFHI
jgi:hypothetical protein